MRISAWVLAGCAGALLWFSGPARPAPPDTAAPSQGAAPAAGALSQGIAAPAQPGGTQPAAQSLGGRPPVPPSSGDEQKSESGPPPAKGTENPPVPAPTQPAAAPAPAQETSPPAMTGEGTPPGAPAAAEQPATQPAAPPTPAPPHVFTIASFGGAYQQSQRLAFFDPFQHEAGIHLEAVSHDGTLDKLREQVKSGTPEWDLVDLPRDLAAKACEEGLLEKLDVDGLLGAGSAQDFIPGAVNDCAIASTAWSALFLYDRRGERGEPKTIADVFDPKKFRGKRALPKNPRYLLEMALMADGVSPPLVYETLKQSEGVSRAFGKLERIKSDIVWWEKPADAIALLAKKEAAMALSFNGRAFDAIVRSREPFGILWDGQIYDLDVWGIVKGAPAEDEAKAFLKFALEPKRLASQTRWFPYGPARVSSAPFTGKLAALDLDIAPFLPTTPANFRGALLFDAAFWAQNGATLDERFAGWADGKLDINGNPVVIPPPQPEKPVPPKVKRKAREEHYRPSHERSPRYYQNLNP